MKTVTKRRLERAISKRKKQRRKITIGTIKVIGEDILSTLSTKPNFSYSIDHTTQNRNELLIALRWHSRYSDVSITIPKEDKGLIFVRIER